MNACGHCGRSSTSAATREEPPHCVCHSDPLYPDTWARHIEAMAEVQARRPSHELWAQGSALRQRIRDAVRAVRAVEER